MDPAAGGGRPTLTSFAVSATSVNVTSGDAHITVTMSVSDPDATGVGTGDVIAHGPTRGYNPAGHLVQTGGTAANAQYRADMTLPAGKAVDYRGHREPAQQRWQLAVDDRIRPGLSRALHGSPLLR